MQLFECVAKGIVFVRVHRVQARENLGLDLLEAGQCLLGGIICPRQGVADLRRFELLDTRDDETHLARRQRVFRTRLRRKDPYLLAEVARPRGHELNAVLGSQHTVDQVGSVARADDQLLGAVRLLALPALR